MASLAEFVIGKWMVITDDEEENPTAVEIENAFAIGEIVAMAYHYEGALMIEKVFPHYDARKLFDTQAAAETEVVSRIAAAADVDEHGDDGEAGEEAQF